ncbi:acetyl-CoA carboxylase biotin carboxyl carrier protein [Actinokineospora sp.]|uniref:acetyl-CoA carboxylase biotin carboxyl carrier protein n=1 Tax=Actinokineospora sp. TaxID=1872133 RepID=UPI0040382321
MSADPEKLLAAVAREACQLLAVAPARPSRLVARAGEVSVELEWPVATGIAAPQAPVPVPVAVAPAPAEQAAPDLALCSPIVGVFHHAPSPGAAPFVSVGDVVRPGQQVGIVEAMKVMIPVEADRRGRVTGVLAADGAAVEFGEPLYALEPATALEPVAS